MTQATSPPKLAVEQVFDRFKEFAKALFDEVAEPRSVALVVDWQIGRNDFPAGMLISREAQVLPGDMLHMSEQLSKMSVRVLQLYGEALNKLDAIGTKLNTAVESKHATLRALTQEVETLEAKNSAAGTSPAAVADDGA